MLYSRVKLYLRIFHATVQSTSTTFLTAIVILLKSGIQALGCLQALFIWLSWCWKTIHTVYIYVSKFSFIAMFQHLQATDCPAWHAVEDIFDSDRLYFLKMPGFLSSLPVRSSYSRLVWPLSRGEQWCSMCESDVSAHSVLLQAQQVSFRKKLFLWVVLLQSVCYRVSKITRTCDMA